MNTIKMTKEINTTQPKVLYTPKDHTTGGRDAASLPMATLGAENKPANPPASQANQYEKA